MSSINNKEKNFISAVVYLHNDGARAVEFCRTAAAELDAAEAALSATDADWQALPALRTRIDRLSRADQALRRAETLSRRVAQARETLKQAQERRGYQCDHDLAGMQHLVARRHQQRIADRDCRRWDPRVPPDFFTLGVFRDPDKIFM